MRCCVCVRVCVCECVRVCACVCVCVCVVSIVVHMRDQQSCTLNVDMLSHSHSRPYKGHKAHNVMTLILSKLQTHRHQTSPYQMR